MSESNLKLHSLGIVVETKPEGTDFILVTPIEELNIQTPGNIKEYKKEYEGSKKELESTNFKTEHEAKNYLRAKWLPFGHSNRNSAPDVVANETVVLFKFADVDEYYWTTIFREPELRRQETVQYAFSNLPKGIAAFDKDTSYWIEVSTKHKYVHLHTSNNDKEHTTYDIKIDTKKGNIEIKDGKKNNILFDSATNSLTVNTENALTINTKNIVNVNTKIANIVASSEMNITSPNINMTGNVNVSGNINGKGDIKAAGSIMDAGGNSNHHSH